ncbi:MAG: hypothetical protein ABFD86_01140 [Bryobacteraceae bacterium]
MTSRLVDELDHIKARFEAGDAARKLSLLRRLSTAGITDAATLIRFHEMLLFLLAYPQNAALAKTVAHALDSVAQRVARLRSRGADLTACEEPEVSGITGTGLSALFSYPVARYLSQAHPSEVVIDWEGYTGQARLGSTLPRFIPLLADDAMVEAHPPYPEWLDAATGSRNRTLRWLIDNLERLPLTGDEKAELYDSLELYLRWDLDGSPAARTVTRLAARKLFYHRGPLIRRSQVSLENEVHGPQILIRRVPVREASRLLALARDTSAVRYRELHGFTHGDPNHMVEADLGRGVRVFVCGVGPSHRLPLRAYHAGMFFKNGVPSGYVEGISFAEKMEVGFNLYYTFREGETAWIYAKMLTLFHQLLGIQCFSVDPYQIGQDNEEGIESGAFWFYRKLGFRPVAADVLHLTEAEENKAAAQPGYRTPARVLRKLARAHMVWEAPGAEPGAWDRFEVRRLGMAVARRTRSHYGANAVTARSVAVRRVAKALGVSEAKVANVPDLALMLDLIPDLERWSGRDKKLSVEWLRAKTAADESGYLRMLAHHERLRRELIRLGSQEE